MRDGVRHHFEPDNAVALEMVCLVVLDHERQMVEEVASSFMLVPHREAMGGGGLAAPIGAASHIFLHKRAKKQTKKAAVLSAKSSLP